MASAARAYAPSRQPKRSTQFRVMPGRRGETALSPHILFLARAFVIVCAVFALVACVRIGLASATVTTTLQTEYITSKVESIRSGSAHLEVAESTLANPRSIKDTAVKKLNMSAPFETDVLKLDTDIVAFDEAGNLSLTRSLSHTA